MGCKPCKEKEIVSQQPSSNTPLLSLKEKASFLKWTVRCQTVSVAITLLAQLLWKANLEGNSSLWNIHCKCAKPTVSTLPVSFNNIN